MFTLTVTDTETETKSDKMGTEAKCESVLVSVSVRSFLLVSVSIPA